VFVVRRQWRYVSDDVHVMEPLERRGSGDESLSRDERKCKPAALTSLSEPTRTSRNTSISASPLVAEAGELLAYPALQE
jgi:hypothetical protein